MKHLKILGMAVVAAAALMAFVGASTASADVLCTTNTTEACATGWRVTKLQASLTSGTKAILETTGGETLVTCTESTVEGADTEGSETHEPGGAITALTWGGCSSTTDTITKGKLSVETVDLGGGKFTHRVKGFEVVVTTNIAGISCSYGTGTGITIGDLTVGSPAEIDANAEPTKVAGGFLCPSATKWTATYKVTNHTGVWISKK